MRRILTLQSLCTNVVITVNRGEGAPVRNYVPGFHSRLRLERLLAGRMPDSMLLTLANKPYLRYRIDKPDRNRNQPALF